jgi:hypothetical protein
MEGVPRTCLFIRGTAPERQRLSWQGGCCLYLVDGPLPLANAPANQGCIRRLIRRPCFGGSLDALFGTYPVQLMKAQNLVRCVMIENPAGAVSGATPSHHARRKGAGA